MVRISGIEPRILTTKKKWKVDDFAQMSIAQRMSWTSACATARLEEEAYSPLEILGINIPLTYGERSAAFIRLQEKIIKTSVDRCIAWFTHDPDYIARVSKHSQFEVGPASLTKNLQPAKLFSLSSIPTFGLASCCCLGQPGIVGAMPSVSLIICLRILQHHHQSQFQSS